MERLEEDVNELLEPTRLLEEALVEAGDGDEQDLGEELLDLIDEVVEIDGDELAAYLVDVIDDTVDSMDDVVDYCDAA